jgi:hypothetical protein
MSAGPPALAQFRLQRVELEQAGGPSFFGEIGMTNSGMFVLQSGRWRWNVEDCNSGEVMELVDPAEPSNKMIVPLPFSWRAFTDEQMQDFVRRPDVRLWRDSAGFFWRVAAVGPGSRYDYPLRTRHLVFDSKHTWAGIVEFPLPDELGDLTNEDLERLRDMISDFGGRRRHFRYSVR